jgi:hypothetical protein
MGYHYVNKWGLPPEAYTNLSVNESVKFTLDMMGDGMKYAKTFEELLRWWNTGSIHGTTYSPFYVTNATTAMEAYEQHLKAGTPENSSSDARPGETGTPASPSFSQTKIFLADVESQLEELLQKVRAAKALL